ncbi:putative bifunctional diguanylate cyclase/phosphodiesterase [Arsukibacterium indicum]|uniref:Bifunctional diguanylate cyclase/phosphodiesterase n=1 Tax=Arsukibacterium indicum TaxID=2848612 RepID=A0ABS6MMN7_9GAMM|nr:bifunctional diguanylate cyclase/phosphodiesterase [Arsukibacterium indicum]MBV2130074.1 bifunctional diguanylate cyclase/phosphodiesterase [Arsukibacterium indicum]
MIIRFNRLLALGLFAGSGPAMANQSAPALPITLLLLVLLLIALSYIVVLKYRLWRALQPKPDMQGFYSLHDDISGFPNKFSLQRKLDDLLKSAPEQQFALILLKVEQFDQINQLLGHSNSNLILAQIAQRINDKLTDEDKILTYEYRQQQPVRVCHLGSVDFAIWLDVGSQPARAEFLARQLQQSVPQPMLVHGCAIDYQLGVGISLYPDHSTQFNELLERAYLALQHSQWHRSASMMFNSEMINYTTEKLALMAELRQAIDEDQLVLFVQPQMAMRNRQVLAAEVLIRWRHPKKGLLAPEAFLALAEEMGVIYPLTLWVLEQAVKTIASLLEQQLVSRIAVNISSKDLLQDELIEALEQLFDTYQVKPQLLMLEVSENALVAEPERTMAMLQRLHRLGVELALDDFGTGFSSLAYLRQLPVQYVKVDCSFISELHKTEAHIAITGAIIDMARNLGLGVIAEGVEGAEVEDKLLRMGCSRGQGFWYSQPFELSGFPAWLRQWQQRHPG